MKAKCRKCSDGKDSQEEDRMSVSPIIKKNDDAVGTWKPETQKKRINILNNKSNKRIAEKMTDSRQ